MWIYKFARSLVTHDYAIGQLVRILVKEDYRIGLFIRILAVANFLTAQIDQTSDNRRFQIGNLLKISATIFLPNW